MCYMENWKVHGPWLIIFDRPPVAAAGIEEAINAEIPLVVWYVGRLCQKIGISLTSLSITEGIPQHGKLSIAMLLSIADQ
jgi:hypothetical protein